MTVSAHIRVIQCHDISNYQPTLVNVAVSAGVWRSRIPSCSHWKLLLNHTRLLIIFLLVCLCTLSYTPSCSPFDLDLLASHMIVIHVPPSLRRLGAGRCVHSRYNLAQKWTLGLIRCHLKLLSSSSSQESNKVRYTIATSCPKTVT